MENLCVCLDKSEFDGGAPVISYAVQGKVIGEGTQTLVHNVCDCVTNKLFRYALSLHYTEEQWTVFGTVANPEAFSTIHTQEQSPDMLSITLSSLAPGTHYEFRVCCTNKVGVSDICFHFCVHVVSQLCLSLDTCFALFVVQSTQHHVSVSLSTRCSRSSN